MEQHKVNLNKWLDNPNIDDDSKKELQNLDETELKERFHKNLEFGTAGLRGILGAGTNRMNIYNIRISSQGFATYLVKNFENPSCAISYDPRKFSKIFAEETALVFAANGIKTYIYKEMRPTPQLSFTINKMKLSGGVMITASHNPKEYNGYKVYGSDGAQVSSPIDEQIINFVNSTKLEDVKIISKEEAQNKGLFIEILEELDIDFIEKTLSLSQIPNSEIKDVKVVYSPLHGAGLFPIKEVFKKANINLILVESQTKPDSDFGDLKFPNPEEKDVFKEAIKVAKENNAPLILATDPDADRVGVCVLDKTGEYVHLTGNQIGIILCEYILSSMNKKNPFSKRAEKYGIITSVVSSKLTFAIAKYYGVHIQSVFTGFKNVGAQILKWEKEGINFIYGFEESFGYQIGSHIRDKDGVGPSLLLAEIASQKNLLEYLEEIYEKYGYYIEDTTQITIKGIEGAEKIKNIMESLRKNPPSLSCNKIIETIDYMPNSNVLYYSLEDEGFICIRPSGTEPKIKIYAGLKAETKNKGITNVALLKDEFLKNFI